MEEFEQHLDTARLWWDLDDAIVVAIIEGRATTEPFRRIALYTRSLKAAAGPAPDESSVTAAVTKIAIRLAATPGAAPAPRVGRSSVGARVVRVLAMALVAMAIAVGLLIAGEATEVIDIPQPIRAILDSIGIVPDESEDQSRRGTEWSPAEGEPIPEVRLVQAVASGESVTASATDDPSKKPAKPNGDANANSDGEPDEPEQEPKTEKGPKTEKEEGPVAGERDSEQSPPEGKDKRDFGESHRPAESGQSESRPTRP